MFMCFKEFSEQLGTNTGPLLGKKHWIENMTNLKRKRAWPHNCTRCTQHFHWQKLAQIKYNICLWGRSQLFSSEAPDIFISSKRTTSCFEIKMTFPTMKLPLRRVRTDTWWASWNTKWTRRVKVWVDHLSTWANRKPSCQNFVATLCYLRCYRQRWNQTSEANMEGFLGCFFSFENYIGKTFHL